MKNIILFTVLALLLLSSWCLSTENDHAEKLNQINLQLQAINAKIQELKLEKKTILNEIYEIELYQDKETTELHKISRQLSDTEEKINDKQQEQTKLEAAIEHSRDNIKKILRVLYKLGGNSYLKLFIRIESVDQLFKNYRLFLSLIKFKQDEINKIKALVIQLDKVKSQLQTEYTSLTSLKNAKEQKIRNIKAYRKNKVDLLRKINEDKNEYQQLLEELKYEAERLDEVISGKKAESSLRIIDPVSIKGRLKWPIKGIVTSHFGRVKSTRFNTYVINNGIRIVPTVSDEVKTIMSGDVVYSDYFKGYGKVIIIQHSRDFHSLYGHCDTILKNKGDHVNENEVIATAGSSGSIVGKNLYFEIRNQAKPVDPLQWLRKKQ